MADKMRVGILGATGAVGQNYICLLENHPFFEVTYVAASPQSAGKKYSEAAGAKWAMDKDMPLAARDLVVEDASYMYKAEGKVDFVFSAVEGTKQEIQAMEEGYASREIPVVSNNSAHRWTPDVPMIIPEINSSHAAVIRMQRQNRGWKDGFIVTKPNCSIQSYLTPVYALMQAGFKPSKLVVTTEQALSGAGYPGVPSLDSTANTIPYISGEDEKTEKEPRKILGIFNGRRIADNEEIAISATCTRVQAVDGHTAIVNMAFAGARPTLEETIAIWEEFRGVPQERNLPSAPNPAIIYRREDNRPQPRRDAHAGKGMAVTVGRLRECPVMPGIKFVGLSHNTIRGAAGGAILTAEYLVSEGYIVAKDGLL